MVGLAVMQLIGFSVFCFFLIIVFSFYQVNLYGDLIGMVVKRY